MSSIRKRYQALLQEVESLSRELDRPPPRVVAVSKATTVDAIREAYAAGVRDFGENRATGLSSRLEDLEDLEDLQWHFIGHLQTNKVSKVVGHAYLVHSVDSCRLLECLDSRARRTQEEPVPVLLQVNVSGENSKSGLPPSGLPAALDFSARLEHITVRGLMTMAPLNSDESVCRTVFADLRKLHQRLLDTREGAYQGTELSMGMSQDFRHAIREGATMLRIGSAIFQEGAD